MECNEHGEAGVRRFRSVLLGWTDPDSGEAVVIDVHGSSRHLRGLEEQGYVVLRDSEPDSSSIAGAVRRTAMGASCHGEPRSAGRLDTGS
jgi:hypothetical protein